MIRGVTIELHNNAWMVLYVNRRKRQRYSAAQFDARDHSRAKVVEWVKAQPKLKLIE